MDEPEINLTKAVDRAAREIFVKAWELSSPRMDRANARAAAGEAWDDPSSQVAPHDRLYWRRLAKAALLEAVAPIARQAWIACAMSDRRADDLIESCPWPDLDLEDL